MVNYFKKFSGNVPEDQKSNFEDFIDNYLLKFYLNQNSQYNFSMWNYYRQIVRYRRKIDVIESINSKLNVAAGKGKLPFHKALSVLVQFKCDYIVDFTNVNNFNSLNIIKPVTLHRKTEITTQVKRFDLLPLSEQLNHAASFALQLHKDLKSSNSELNDFCYLPDFNLSFHFAK